MYCKLFTSIYQGTLRGRSDEILVFTNLLAHCDKEGIVDKHPRAIADEVGISLQRVNAALLELEAVDPESRSPENEGRRITRVDEHRAWGWQVTNYAKYRAIRNDDDRREQNRLAQERWRNKNKQSKPRSAHAEADSYEGKNADAVLLSNEKFREAWETHCEGLKEIGELKLQARHFGLCKKYLKSSSIEEVTEAVSRAADHGFKFIKDPRA